jgi:hypothetical protein
MPLLPDPRPRAASPADHPLAARLDAVLAANDAGDGGRAEAGLAKLLRRMLASGEDPAVDALIGRVGDPAARVLIRALDTAIHGGDEDAPGSLVARVFLLPVVFITAGRAPAEVSGALPDAAHLAGLMRRAGALGPVENFGLGNALAGIDAARALSPVALHRFAHDIGNAGAAELLAPEPIALTSADETAHLRFLAGVSLTAADAPTVLETAGTVGRWGIAVSQAMHEQLAVEGLSLLALPRAPMPWFRALAEGAFAREEIAFNLFATNALRRIRAETGEPDIVVTSRDDGTVRVDMTSPFDAQLHHAHAWKLGPADDIARVEVAILDLLRDCRAERVETRPDVLPAGELPVPGVTGVGIRH